MNIFLWVLQVLLAAEFFWHGLIFLFPPAELVDIMNKEFPVWFRMFLGGAEVLAAVGLTLPGILRILPSLIPVTSVCLMIVVASATVLHVSRDQAGSAIMTVVLFLVLAFVGYMRWKVAPIIPRTEKHQ